jgi:hypothetical protein
MSSSHLGRALLVDINIGRYEFVLILSSRLYHAKVILKYLDRANKCSASIPGIAELEADNLNVVECGKVSGKRAHVGNGQQGKGILNSCPLGRRVPDLGGESSN